METTQMIFAGAVVAITIMLGVIATQLYYVLKEFRQTLTKANKVLDDTALISESVSKPVSMISSMITGVKGWSSIIKLLTKDKK